MKKNIVRFLVLLGLFGSSMAGPVTGQTVALTHDDLLIYRLKHIPVVYGPPCGGDCVNLSSDIDFMLQQLALVLTPQGSVEIDARSKTLIIVDTAERRALLAEVLTLIDTPSPSPGTSADTVVTKTVTVHTNYVEAPILCWGVAGPSPSREERARGGGGVWSYDRARAFFDLIQSLLSPVGSFEIQGSQKQIVLTDIPERVSLLRRVVEICDVLPPKVD